MGIVVAGVPLGNAGEIGGLGGVTAGGMPSGNGGEIGGLGGGAIV